MHVLVIANIFRITDVSLLLSIFSLQLLLILLFKFYLACKNKFFFVYFVFDNEEYLFFTESGVCDRRLMGWGVRARVVCMDGTDEEGYRIYCVNPYVKRQSISFVVVYSTNLFLCQPRLWYPFHKLQKHECHEHQEKSNNQEEEIWV